MSRLITTTNQKKIERFFRQISETFHIKLPVYKSVIVPTQLIALHRIRKIVSNSNPIVEKKTGKKIIFNPVDARYTTHSFHEGGLAKALQLRGHQVKMFICGGLLDMCVGHFTIKKPPNTWRCKNCIKFSEDFYKTINLPYSTYGEIINQEELAAIKDKVNKMSFEKCEKFVYKNVNVSYHASTSAQRYFIGKKVSKEDYEYVFRTELINAIISTDIAEKIVKEENPDILVTSHGCYSTWGCITDYFKNNGIRVVVWYSGYNRNTLHFDIGNIDEYFKIYFEKIRKGKPLNKKENEELDNFIKKRIKGEEGDTALYSYTNVKKDLETRFDFQSFEKNYAMFPNIAWDSSMIGDTNVAFKNIYEWVSYTIKLFKDKKNLQLILKIHPAEIVHESKATLLEHIKSNFDTLPDNIKILPPNTQISAYSLFPYIDAGLLYSGTLCLEMAIQNVPVIMVGKSRYSRLSFTNPVTTKEKYQNIIESGPPPISKEDKELSRVYGYFYFIKNFIPRPWIYYNSFLDLGWNINSFDDFKPGKNKYLDHICDYIINGGIYQDW